MAPHANFDNKTTNQQVALQGARSRTAFLDNLLAMHAPISPPPLFVGLVGIRGSWIRAVGRGTKSFVSRSFRRWLIYFQRYDPRSFRVDQIMPEKHQNDPLACNR